MFPTFGTTPVPAVTPAEVRTWHAALGKRTGPTARAHAYALLRTVMNTAVADDLIVANPCRVRGAGQSRRVKKIVPATLAELAALTKAMPGKLEWPSRAISSAVPRDLVDESVAVCGVREKRSVGAVAIAPDGT